MENYNEYLKEHLKKFGVALQQDLNNYKKELNSELNSFLLSKISEAEEAIEIAKIKYLKKFEEDMKYVEEERKEKNPSMAKSLDLMEKSIRDNLERGLRITTNLWKTFIEDCHSKMR